MSARHFPSLDQLDIQLMTELESDAGQSCRSLAAKLALNRLTVTNKKRRLLDGDVIRHICWVDPFAAGYKFIIALGISAEAGRIDYLVDKISTCPRISQVYACMGRFNIIAWAIFREVEDVSDFLSNELGPLGVPQLEMILTLQIVKLTPRLLTDEKEPRPSENAAKSLDDLDRKLIRELQINPGQSSKRLVEKLGVYKSTINRRIQKLTADHVIHIEFSINPFALGYEGMALIGLKCAPDKVREVADAVALYKQSQYVGICIGRYDLMAWVEFQQLSDLRHFITVELGGIPGLRDTDTTIVYKQVKTADWLSFIRNGTRRSQTVASSTKVKTVCDE